VDHSLANLLERHRVKRTVPKRHRTGLPEYVRRQVSHRESTIEPLCYSMAELPLEIPR
jgi:septation ring formation regulator EzrA